MVVQLFHALSAGGRPTQSAALSHMLHTVLRLRTWGIKTATLTLAPVPGAGGGNVCVGAGRRPAAASSEARPPGEAANLPKGGSTRCPHLARADVAESPHRE
ncbi:hypothetical protein ACJJTC_000556 [Scirpophaga incertulas]